MEKNLNQQIVPSTTGKDKFFSKDEFWSKLQLFAKKAGHSVVYAALLLYYTLQKNDLPVWVRTTIIGSLGYFILPFDLIPDFAAGVGYTDDFGALGAALLQVSMYIDEEVKQKAKNKLNIWFGSEVDTTVVDQKLF
ncbi:DUF1232 domain-containing protein [Pontibacillus yanchengensis]|uniref:DUF1232 domain-containing protein n=2 Tax=Pontibacillus yanchengensis TaxID=462910 RepID=A0ACC7VDT8_9BACI|nr:YkvA family protein [Pontibacillus yanchengensis]MYL35325.1 DUF1232 domain-containing protein [Pontibacillus yanchengensis]MYL52354.1 DUF1232 domain-containing protein [Pontibacillus yanchengensis]